MISSILNKIIRCLNEYDICVKFENRNSSNSWVYNGRSIALYSDVGDFLEHDHLHEIGHYIVAHPDQRLFPEYGLTFGIVDLGAWGEIGEGYRLKNGNLDYDAVFYLREGLVNLYEQEIQEFLAQKIAIFFGKECNFPSAKLLGERPGPWDTWPGYEDMKKQELYKKDSIFQEEVNDRFHIFLPLLKNVCRKI